MTMGWEYLVEDYGCPATEVQDRMTITGAGGWELVAVVVIAPMQFTRAFFKRPTS